MRKEFLLRGLKGELEMMKYLPFMTETDVITKKPRWCIADEEYDVHPFGKLIRTPAKYHTKGYILEHKKYYHGFFMNLKCTEGFYNQYSHILDKYICTENHINREFQPSWMN